MDLGNRTNTGAVRFDLFPGRGKPFPIRVSVQSPQVFTHYDLSLFTCGFMNGGGSVGHGGVSTYRSQKYADAELAKNPTPLPQRGESLARFFLQGGENTYSSQGQDGFHGVEDAPSPPTMRGKSLAKFLSQDGSSRYRGSTYPDQGGVTMMETPTLTHRGESLEIIFLPPPSIHTVTQRGAEGG